MSRHRELTPGAWVLNTTISADELNALDLAAEIRADYAGHVPWNRAIQGDLAAIERAIYPARTARDECHHCGAPSPGDECRYCNTVHRRMST